MSYGYSTAIVKLNRQVSARHLGVQLGRYCIRHSIPVQEVAEHFNVSRQTIYNWFCGTTKPRDKHVTSIKAYLV